MATQPSPTARRLELARRLRDLRLAVGRSVEEVAGELMCSPAKVSRLETGQRAIQARDVRDLSRYYQVSDAVASELMQLAADARKRGWWQDYRVLDEQTATFIGLEEATLEMRNFETFRIPGLLQTPDYTRAWVSRMRPPEFWQPGQIDEIVEVRQLRQKSAFDRQLVVHAILDEAAFARPVGSPTVMADQLEKLADWAERDHIEFQVVPLAAGPHPGLDGSFLHLRFGARALADMIYIEGQFGSTFIEKPEDVRQYLNVHAQLSRLAMTELETIDWLHGKQRQFAHNAAAEPNQRP